MAKSKKFFVIKIAVVLMAILTVILIITFKKDKIGSSATIAPTKNDPVPIKRTTWEFGAIEPPFKVTDKVIGEGKIIFQNNCASCHGYRGEKTGHPLAVHGLHHVNADYVWFVTRGKAGTAMPSFKKYLSYKDRWKVILYVHTHLAGREPMRMANGSVPAYLQKKFNPGDYFKLGEWYFNKREFVDAAVYYRLAYSNNPKDIVSANDLALSLFYAGKTKSAVKTIGNISKQVPSNQRIWLTYGFIEKDIDPDKAAAAFKSAIKLDPRTATGLAAKHYLDQIQ